MRKIVSGIVLIASTVLFAQDSFNLHSVFNDTKADTNMFTQLDTKGKLNGSRGVWGGTDIDKDGREEIWVTDYTHNSTVHAFEWYYGDTLVHVWSAAANSAYDSGMRWVQTGDTDGDGLEEVIVFNGYWQTDTLAGLYFYEWDGVNDNGYGTLGSDGRIKPTWFRNLQSAFDDSLKYVKVEHFTVDDIDGDGRDEIIFASNGSSNPNYGTKSTTHAAYSEDRFVIAGVTGDIGSSITPPVLNEEFAASPRDTDKDGVRENKFGGGSPQSVVVADTDGDGNKEAICFAWNNLSCFIIEATGPNAYVQSDTGYKFTDRDDWTMAATVVDMNKDGKDEVYVGAFYKGIVYVVGDTDGDATTFTTSEFAPIDSLATSWPTSNKGNVEAFGASASNNAFGDPAFFVGHGKGFSKYDLTGSDIFSSSSYTRLDVVVDTNQTGNSMKIFAGSNMDKDKFGEVIIAYMGVADSLYSGTDSVKVNPDNQRIMVRVMEWTGASSELAVKDMVLITPEDYKLSQNYPNPFNPTTTIEYTLPIASKITISIFNVMGQEVAKLIQNQDKPAGTYQVTWNGMDKSGNQVASGTYFYSMRFGNFTKTKQMTFMK
jgi:hypothetical protein